MIKSIIFWLGILFSATISYSQTYSILHSFSYAVTNGGVPFSNPVVSGSYLYGMGNGGGENNAGTIYKMNVDGSEFTVLHSFTNESNAVYGKLGSLIISGSVLYGGTRYDGEGYGTIFKMNTNGTGYTVLHTFTNSTTDGNGPVGSLILSDNVLYGMTGGGGASVYKAGTIFKMNTDGSDFSLLHSFTLGSDGGYPKGSLVLYGSVLYGMSGESQGGKIFKINTDGTGFTVIHTFSIGTNDGNWSPGSLTLKDGYLYGVRTIWQGQGGYGSIFKIKTDGSDFSIIHSFGNTSGDGIHPLSSLTLVGTELYGTTFYGGSYNYGTLYKIKTDGSGYSVLHSFANLPNDGAYPIFGYLAVSNNTIYGCLTADGGDNNLGKLFSYSFMPSVSTTEISEITSNSASSGGNVTGDGFTISARGVCWNTTGNPTISDSYTNDGTGTGTFTSNLSSLEPCTYYYVRAYATNSAGTAYGNQVEFTTEPSQPDAICQNITVQLNETGNAEISPSDIDNGSYSQCGNIVSMSVEPSSFNCSNIGENTIILTVTDNNNNSSTCEATITVNGSVPEATITVDPEYTITGETAHTIYLGYGPQSVTLEASGGVSYSWSSNPSGFSSTSQNPTVSPTVTTTYTVTVTNEYGCTASATVTINVEDWRCGNHNSKIKVCHNGKTICVSTDAVQAHLDHGDDFGNCVDPKAGSNESSVMDYKLEQNHPNPFDEETSIKYTIPVKSNVTLKILDLLFNDIMTLVDGTQDAGNYNVLFNSKNLPSGVYIFRIEANGIILSKQMIIIK